jgi:hypothetical protein
MGREMQVNQANVSNTGALINHGEIGLRLCTAYDREVLRAYCLPEEQAIYTTMPVPALEACMVDPCKHPYVISAAGREGQAFLSCPSARR